MSTPLPVAQLALPDKRAPLETTDIAVYKALLADTYEGSKAAFMNGAAAREVVMNRAARLDELMRHLWQRAGLEGEAICLLAVGGYGRAELHPFSDIDLAIVLGEQPAAEVQKCIERLVVFLWDIGLEIGHSVRTIDQSVEAACDDLSVMTNLLESRYLCGDEAIFTTLKQHLDEPEIWPVRDFFSAKLDEQSGRHQKLDGALQRLQPNIKESPGGLRDIQVIAWVANRHFRTAGLPALVEHGFLTVREFEQLTDGETFLWKIRCALHFLTDRHEDRLSFDHQKSVAELLGYSGSRPNQAVELFMKDYYQTVRELSCLNEMLLSLFSEAILEDAGQAEVRKINRRFQVTNGRLEVSHPKVFQRTPPALLEIFLILQQNPDITHIRAATIRLLLANRHRIDESFRNDIRAQSLFMEIIRQPRRIGHELQRMHRYGILSAYLQVFAKVEGLMQFDLFHIFTVDEHSLVVVRYMRRFSFPENDSDRIALVPYVLSNIPKLEILYIAGLFHDIAKGRGGDHSELGANDAAEFCQRHSLSNFDTHLTAWLVRNHLLMSTIAQRKDIYDPNVINEFARELGDQIYLDYLYLLTIADMRGTNPDLWNGWKESLLAELYSAARKRLAEEVEPSLDETERIEETKKLALEIIGRKAIRHFAQTKLWPTLDAEYFLRHRPQEIAWHAEEIALSNDDSVVVATNSLNHRAATALFVYAPDADNFFAVTTAALDKLRLDIQDARIITSSDGYTLDTYMLLDRDSSTPIIDESRIAHIEERVYGAIRAGSTSEPELSRADSRVLKNFHSPVFVEFNYDEIHNYTIMGVHAVDRPGLLSTLGNVMRQFGIRLHDARIATIGERAEDYFCITLRSGDSVVGLAMQEELREAITAALTVS